jgi:hypothetical protein
MIMLKGRDYLSELRPPTDILFTCQVIDEHGEPWWNDVNKAKLLIHPPELSGNPTSAPTQQQIRRIWTKEMMDLV